MTNINGHQIAIEDFDIAVHALPLGYFENKLNELEEQNRSDFPNGWPEFYAKYSKGELDGANLEYDEWAFVCEHFLRDHTRPCEPPGISINACEEPELSSGFSFGGRCLCSILSHTSKSLKNLSQFGLNVERR
jgi:hypothetical protein